MRATLPIDPELRESVLDRLHDVSSWSSWVPGLREVTQKRGAARMDFGGPRPFRCSVKVERPADGVTFQLEEGELRAFGGSITVEPAAIHLDIEVQFGPNVPGALWSSLSRDYGRRVLSALQSEALTPDVQPAALAPETPARQGSDRPAG